MSTLTPTRTETVYFSDGKSDKQYTLTVNPVAGGFEVVASYGRRGSTLAQQNKTPEPVTLEAATKLYEKILQEKLRKGYRPGADAAPMAKASATIAPTKQGFAITRNPCPSCGKPPFGDEYCCGCPDPNSFKPMLLNSITDPEPFLKSREWVMQEKADGVRAIIFVATAEPGIRNAYVQAFSRVGLPVAITVECSKVLAAIFAGCIIDAEVIGETVTVFDLLSHGGTDLRAYSCEDRLRALQSKFTDARFMQTIVRIIRTAHTEKDKRTMLKRLHADGAEGVVFKQAAAKYAAGRPSSGGPALKLKFTAGASLRVVAIGSKGKQSVDVALEDGTVVASVSTIGRPVPRLNSIVECAYLYAYKGGGLVQPVYKAIRTDKRHADTSASLQYKGESRTCVGKHDASCAFAEENNDAE
jgi:bifunctional non-homologous end joining protein LigD